jgi:DNA-binding transcriptional MerR regulator
MERRGLLPAIRTAGGVRLFERRDIERLAEERAKESSRQGREPAPSM